MDDEPLIEEASAIVDRRPVSTTSPSEGIRLLDRLARLFGAPAPASPASTGDVLFLWGPLEVRRLLGAGSFGEVYEAWDPTLHREVALKLRDPEMGALRWLGEARNLARIRHPNVLTVYGADVLDGRAGIWTERLLGLTLEEELTTSGPFAEKEVVRIGRDIASALAAVHAAGLIHGDVKTSNIMLEAGDARRRVVLVDFGSADRMPGEDDVPMYAMGTPLTMAPEVLDGKPASAGADVYGLGATLFRLLTGHYPVEAASIEEIRRAHRSSERAHVRAFASQVSARLARVVERAIEPDPAKRWPNAKALERALADIADPTRRIRMRAAAIGGSVVGVAALAFIAYLFLRPGGGPISRARLAAPSNPNAFTVASRQFGPEEEDGYGWVAAIVDMDHDGKGDVVAAQAFWKSADGVARGRIMIYRGGAEASSSAPFMTIDGDQPHGELGYQLCNAGDTDGDGFDELLVSHEARETGEMHSRVHLYAGQTGGGPPVQVWELVGKSRDAGLGRGMSSAGDVNGDGYDDVLIGESSAPDLLYGEGRVLLFLGSRAGLARTPVWSVRGGQSNAWMGRFMRPLGDVNADGFDDVLVGAPIWDGTAGPDCGRAMLFLGGAGGPSDRPAWTFEGANANARLGTTVAGAGDVNGDGFDDALVGEPQYSDPARPERGRALVFLGGPNGLASSPAWQAVGPVSYAHFGSSVDRLGDVDGDGYDDIAISAPQYTEGTRTHLGMVEVYRGNRDGCEARPFWRAVGDAADENLGWVVITGDINGDHVRDLVVGAPLWSDKMTERGLIATYLARSPGKHSISPK